jgi:hypothetical protein
MVAIMETAPRGRMKRRRLGFSIVFPCVRRFDG